MKTVTKLFEAMLSRQTTTTWRGPDAPTSFHGWDPRAGDLTGFHGWDPRAGFHGWDPKAGDVTGFHGWDPS